MTIHPSQDTLFYRPIKAKNPPENTPKFGYIKKHPAWVRVLPGTLSLLFLLLFSVISVVSVVKVFYPRIVSARSSTSRSNTSSVRRHGISVRPRSPFW